VTDLSFTVPGNPRGKGRPRFGRTRSGAPIAFTDSKTASYENLVALAAQQAGASPVRGALDLTVRVRVTPPASASKAMRLAMLEDREPPAKRPDLDNIGKAISDGLNGIAYADDAQIVSLTMTKVYADTAGVDVLVRPHAPRTFV
jgi:Holliday junction resolvase RusA-like endonuclease